MTDPDIEAEVAEFMGLAGRIIAARLDEDYNHVAAIVNADRNAALNALIEALTSIGVHMYGSPEAAGAMFRSFALRAELHGLDAPHQQPEGEPQ